MKKEKGITLTALTIYIILFIMLMGMLAVLSTDFNSGIGRVQHSMTSPEEYNKFNVEFLRDIKESYYTNIEQLYHKKTKCQTFICKKYCF